MKIFFFIIIMSFSLIFLGCKNEKNTNEKKLKDFMVGKWETQYIKIEYPTYQKTDSSFVFEDDFSNPNTGRAQSEYLNDGTFTAWFKNPDSTRILETKGTWKTKGQDSLFVNYQYSGNKVQAWYSIQQKDNQFSGVAIYDWDIDGTKDDTLIMKSKRIQ